MSVAFLVPSVIEKHFSTEFLSLYPVNFVVVVIIVIFGMKEGYINMIPY